MTTRHIHPGALLPLGLLLLLGATGVGTADPGASHAVRVTSLRGATVLGTLTALGPDEVVVKATSGERRVALRELRTLEMVSPVPPAPSAEGLLRVLLTTDEVLIGTFGGEVTDGLRLDTQDFGSVSVPFDVVRTLVPVPSDAGPCYEPEHRYRAGEEDTAYARSGDAISGILLSAGDEGLELETERGRDRRVGWADLLVLHLQNEAPDAADGLLVEVETVEGSRLVTAKPPRVEGGALVLGPLALPERLVRVPLSRVRVVRTRGGAFVYASDLPFESEFVPYYQDDPVAAEFLSQWYAARANRRPTGCPLRLDGTVYRHGIAVHSRSTIRLQLEGRYSHFESLFGVDDEALSVAAGGVVDARVVGDGKVLWQAKDVRAGAPPRRLGPLDVSEVRELRLEVDFGADIYILDRATWADPVLHRR